MEMEPRAIARRFAALLTLLAIVGSGCSVTPDNESRPIADISTVTLGEPLALPTRAEQVLLPVRTSDAQWVEVDPDREDLCVAAIVGVVAERSCSRGVDFAVHPDSVIWATGAESLFFTSDIFSGRDEPDIWEFSIGERRLTNLTDDNTDELFVERASIDVLPFTSEAGELHFFTFSRGQSVLSTVDADGRVRVLRDIDLVGSPGPVIHPVGSDRFVYVESDRDLGASLVVLDLGQRTREQIIVRSVDDPFIAAAGQGVAVIGDVQSIITGTGTGGFQLVHLDTGSGHELDLGAASGPPTFAFAPDGSSLLALTRHRDTGEHQLLGFQRDESGTVSGPFGIAPGGFLGRDSDDRPRTPRFTLTPIRIAWTDDNRLLVPTQDDMVLVFDLLEPR